MNNVKKFLEANCEFLRDQNEPNRIFTKGYKIEGIYLLISKGIPLFRTEGVGDITLFTIKGDRVEYLLPAILPEKIQAKIRRRMLEILRGSFTDDLKRLMKEKYEKLHYKKIGDNGSWNCYIAPPLSEGGTDIGMCGFCPACTILGSMITDNELEDAKTSYGLKSRVHHDIAFATTAYEKAVSEMTHNKVGDGVSYTGMALFEEQHVLPGVCFIGKVVLNDVTMMEAKLVLSSLTTITRMGAGETKFGSVQTILLGLKAGKYETISSYDVVRKVLDQSKGELIPPEDVLTHVLRYIKEKGFTPLLEDSNINIGDADLTVEMSNDEIKTLWDKDNYFYAEQVVKYIERTKKAGGKEGSRERKAKEGEEE
ncbi:MAG: type I-D CRISPR-associated protein Cas7/Csc2 [Nitrososphaerota archaeon]